MFFLQMAQAPVVVTLPDSRVISIPKFTLEDLIAWGAEIMSASIETLTKDLDDLKRREFLLLYPPIEPHLGEMKQRLQTPAGVRRVLRTCLSKASPELTVTEIEGIIAASSGQSMELAWRLADLNDGLRQQVQVATEGGGASPLTASGKSE